MLKKNQTIISQDIEKLPCGIHMGVLSFDGFAENP